MPHVAATHLENSVLLGLYRTMQLVRHCELQLAKSNQQGLVHGACHTYVGQEAVAAGVCAHLWREDVVFSTHRGHGHALAKGVSPEQLIAELYGRETGCSAGRGGSMHLFAPEVGLMGTSGIVGPSMLQAVGAGYSFKLLKSERIAVAFFGDGAVNNGAFHEALNLASIWNLPVLFVCENNGYATEVPFSYAAGNPSVAARGEAYGLPAVELDGNDVLAVYAAAQQAVARARRGEGATLIECLTYRVRSHAEGMADFTYRSKGEVESWKKRCPILRLQHLLCDESANPDPVDRSVLDAIDREVTEMVAAAHHAAELAQYPSGQTARNYVYADPPHGTHGDRDRPGTIGQVQPTCPAGTREITFAAATLEALVDAMRDDPTLFVLGEGIGARGGNFNTTTGLYERYGPQRLCDTPICERGFVGMCAGAAMTGTRPVVDFMFADFILDAVGEIVNQIAKIRYMSHGRLEMPVVLRGCIGIGHSAATHHSGSYYSMFAHFPGLRVVVPSTPYDAKGLFAHALHAHDPVIFLEHRELLNVKGPVPDSPYEIPFGQAAIVRPGTDVTVVAVAEMVHKCLQAIKQLDERGIAVELIDPRTIAPLDCDTILQSVAKTGRLLIADETFAPFGLGAEIAAQVGLRGFNDLDAPIHRLNGAHAPTPYSPSLEAVVVPQVEDVVQAILDLLEEYSVPTPITVPRLGWSMDEGLFAGWLKQDGDQVRAGDALFELESDKATQEVESFDEGILRLPSDAPQVGDTVRVGQCLGYLCERGELVPTTCAPVDASISPANAMAAADVGVPSAPQLATVPPTNRDNELPTSSTVDSPPAPPSVRRLARELGIDLHQLAIAKSGQPVTEADVRSASKSLGERLHEQSNGCSMSEEARQAVTPRAAQRALQLGVDLSHVIGTGRGNRIRERDVLAAAQAPPAGKPSPQKSTSAVDQESVAHAAPAPSVSSGGPPGFSVRKTIADRMVAASQQTAPVTLMVTTDATAVVRLREGVKRSSILNAIEVPTITELMIKLVATALEKHPDLIQQWGNRGLFLPDGIHLSVAVHTEHGLFAPVLRNVNTLSLAEIARQLRLIAERARARQLTPDDLQGGTFTLSNLGSYAVDGFTPILNLPQSAVLGIGRIRRVPAVVENEVAIRDQLHLSLTFDHRVHDGATPAAFLQTLCELLGNPEVGLIT